MKIGPSSKPTRQWDSANKMSQHVATVIHFLCVFQSFQRFQQVFPELCNGLKEAICPSKNWDLGVPNSWTWRTTQLLHQGSFSCPKAEVTQWPSRLLRRNLDSPLGRPQGAKTKRSLDHCNVSFFGVHLTWKPGSLVSVSSRFNWKKNTGEHVSITILLLLSSYGLVWAWHALVAGLPCLVVDEKWSFCGHYMSLDVTSTRSAHCKGLEMTRDIM